MEKYDLLNVYTDGASRGNPGLGAWSFIIKDKSNERVENGGDILRQTTNNSAEYKAICEGLDRAIRYRPHIINIYSDSDLVINQLNKKFKTKSPYLKMMLTKINKLINNTDSIVNFYWIPRGDNHEADTLGNTLMNDYERKHQLIK
jgi:ribonuclease HI